MTKHIGAHVSASGGVFNAITNAVAIGADAFALFTRNQRAWVSKPLDEAETGKFKRLMQEHNFAPEQVLPHDSYLINLGSPDPETLEKSRNAFLDVVLSMACVNYRMVAEEAINATTINTAYAMDCSDTLGSIAKGKTANVFITKPIPSIEFMPYAYGSNKVETVILNMRTRADMTLWARRFCSMPTKTPMSRFMPT